MTKEDYDNIASCVRRRGTKSQRKALRGFMSSTGWDLTHGNKLEIKRLRSRIAELETDNYLLRRAVNNKQEAKDVSTR